MIWRRLLTLLLAIAIASAVIQPSSANFGLPGGVGNVGPLAGPPPTQSFAFVRIGYFFSTGSGPGAFPIPVSAITAGDMVIIGCDSDISTIGTPTDTLGNTYNSLGTVITWTASKTIHIQLFATFSAIGGTSPTISCNFPGTGGSYGEVWFAEYSHAAPVTQDSVMVSATGTGLTYSSGNITTTATGATGLVIGFVPDPVDSVPTNPPTGFTQRSGPVMSPNNPNTGNEWSDQINVAGGVYVAADGETGSRNWVAMIFAFK